MDRRSGLRSTTPYIHTYTYVLLVPFGRRHRGVGSEARGDPLLALLVLQQAHPKSWIYRKRYQLASFCCGPTSTKPRWPPRGRRVSTVFPGRRISWDLILGSRAIYYQPRPQNLGTPLPFIRTEETASLRWSYLVE